MRIRAAHLSMRSVTAIGLAGCLLLATAGCNEHPGVVTSETTMMSSGGSVIVQCIDASSAKLAGWQPASGYTARVIVQGPSGQPSILFSSPSAADVRVAVHCVDSQPYLDEFDEEDTGS